MFSRAAASGNRELQQWAHCRHTDYCRDRQQPLLSCRSLSEHKQLDQASSLIPSLRCKSAHRRRRVAF